LEKLQKEREEKDKKDKKAAEKAAKKERKERREKKEKRKREKEEKKLKDSTTSLASVAGIKFKLNNEVKEHGTKLQKVEYENEQLERSGITEEHEQPVCSPQEPYSSDSSQSSKRKRGTELPSQDHGE